METKVCSVCGIEKPLTRDYFHYFSRAKSGFKGNCIDCVREYKRSYLQKKRGPAYKPRSDYKPRVIRNPAPIVKKLSTQQLSGKRKTPFALVEELFEEKNYILLSDKEAYHNNTSKLKYKCKKHSDKGILTISWAELNRGRGCKYCGLESRSSKSRLKFEDVKKAFEERNYFLLETEYINNRKKMRYICPYHPNKVQTIMYTHLKNGAGCKDCSIDSYSGENCYNWKGGISPLRRYLRDKMIDWKYDTMEACGYKCVISGEKFDDIHHLYGFDLILEEIVQNTGITLHRKINQYTDEELNKLFVECKRLHDKYGLGVCLKKEIHTEFHNMYGYGSNTPEQFEEFKLKYFVNQGTKREPI